MRPKAVVEALEITAFFFTESLPALEQKYQVY